MRIANLFIAFGTSLVLLAGNSLAALPSTKDFSSCDGLDPTSGLYSACIDAHSTAPMVPHLCIVGASANAINKRRAALAEAKARYAELAEGAGVDETVPGFESVCPCNAFSGGYCEWNSAFVPIDSYVFNTGGNLGAIVWDDNGVELSINSFAGEQPEGRVWFCGARIGGVELEEVQISEQEFYDCADELGVFVPLP